MVRTESRESRTDRAAGDRADLRVVVVDDDPGLLVVVRRCLARVRWIDVVATAVDGTSGIAAVDREQPDVVLLDLHLAGQDGADLIGPLIRCCSHVMVAAFSALPASEHAAAVRQLGAFASYPESSLPSLPGRIRRDHELFARALTGEDVVAPAAHCPTIGFPRAS